MGLHLAVGKQGTWDMLTSWLAKQTHTEPHEMSQNDLLRHAQGCGRRPCCSAIPCLHAWSCGWTEQLENDLDLTCVLTVTL